MMMVHTFRTDVLSILTFLWVGHVIGEGPTQLDLNFAKHLTSFMTRPEIKAPLLDVTIYEPEKVSSGYWFLTPYGRRTPSIPNTCQVGPHIYDSDGVCFFLSSPLLSSSLHV